MANTAAELISRAPEAMVALVENTKATIQRGERIDADALWNQWHDIEVNIDPPVDSQANVMSGHLIEQRKISKAHHRLRWSNLDELAKALEARPSPSLLNDMSLYITSKVAGSPEVHEKFMRLTKKLGHGGYGIVRAGVIGTADMDAELVESDDPLTLLYSYPPHYAVKIQEDAREECHIDSETGEKYFLYFGTTFWMQEFIVAKEVESIIDKIHIMPKMYAISRVMHEHQYRYMYQEYIHGNTLFSARQSIPDNYMYGTLAVIHATLAYMYKKWGFVHCDTSTCNIMLRMDPTGEYFDVPVLDEDGNVSYHVRLPWHPVLVDPGLAVTKKNSTWSTLSSPYANTLTDVARLYGEIIKYFPESAILPLIDYYKLHYNKVLVMGKNVSYLAPVGIDIPELSHTSLLNFIEEQDSYANLMVREPIHNKVKSVELIPIDLSDENKRWREVDFKYQQRRSLSTEVLNEIINNVH